MISEKQAQTLKNAVIAHPTRYRMAIKDKTIKNEEMVALIVSTLEWIDGKNMPEPAYQNRTEITKVTQPSPKPQPATTSKGPIGLTPTALAYLDAGMARMLEPISAGYRAVLKEKALQDILVIRGAAHNACATHKDPRKQLQMMMLTKAICADARIYSRMCKDLMRDCVFQAHMDIIMIEREAGSGEVDMGTMPDLGLGEDDIPSLDNPPMIEDDLPVADVGMHQHDYGNNGGTEELGRKGEHIAAHVEDAIDAIGEVQQLIGLVASRLKPAQREYWGIPADKDFPLGQERLEDAKTGDVYYENVYDFAQMRRVLDSQRKRRNRIVSDDATIANLIGGE